MKSNVKIAAIFLFVSSWVQAEEGFVLQVDPKKYPTAPFQKGLEKKVETMPEGKSRMIPEKEDREAVFSQVPELQPHLSKLDEMGRDILFVRAKTLKPQELKKFYPKIPAKALADLKNLALEKSK